MPAQVAEKPASLTFYPFAYALYNENLPQHCWYCLDEERTHFKCTACGIALFCNKECQTLGWKDHMYECKALRKTQAVPNIEVRLLGRIVARHKAILAGKDKNDPSFYKDRSSRRNIMDIWAHTKNMRDDPYAMANFNSIYDELVKFYDAKALLPKDTVFELHCRDFINRHAISDSGYLKEIGKGLYLDLCAYDHSCRPNTVYVCKGFVATLRPLNTSVNLLDRSSTFYSYIDLFCGKQARKKLLKDTWYFNCECDRCQDNSEHILTSMLCPNCKVDERNRLCLFGEHGYKDAKTQLITCPACDNKLSEDSVMEALGAMRFIDDVLDKREVEQMSPANARSFIRDLLERFENLLPKVNVYYCKLIQALIQYTEPSDSVTLLRLHKDAEECLRVCYPKNHPALAFHCRNIGIFSRKVGSLSDSINYLGEAKSIFDYVLQPDHPLSKSTSDLLLEAENELNRLKKASENARKKGSSAETQPLGTDVEAEAVVEAKSDESDNSQRSTSSLGVKIKAHKAARSPTPLPELIQSDDSVPSSPKATEEHKLVLPDVLSKQEHNEGVKDAHEEAVPSPPWTEVKKDKLSKKKGTLGSTNAYDLGDVPAPTRGLEVEETQQKDVADGTTTKNAVTKPVESDAVSKQGQKEDTRDEAWTEVRKDKASKKKAKNSSNTDASRNAPQIAQEAKEDVKSKGQKKDDLPEESKAPEQPILAPPAQEGGLSKKKDPSPEEAREGEVPETTEVTLATGNVPAQPRGQSAKNEPAKSPDQSPVLQPPKVESQPPSKQNKKKNRGNAKTNSKVDDVQRTVAPGGAQMLGDLKGSAVSLKGEKDSAQPLPSPAELEGVKRPETTDDEPGPETTDIEWKTTLEITTTGEPMLGRSEEKSKSKNLEKLNHSTPPNASTTETKTVQDKNESVASEEKHVPDSVTSKPHDKAKVPSFPQPAKEQPQQPSKQNKKKNRGNANLSAKDTECHQLVEPAATLNSLTSPALQEEDRSPKKENGSSFAEVTKVVEKVPEGTKKIGGKLEKTEPSNLANVPLDQQPKANEGSEKNDAAPKEVHHEQKPKPEVHENQAPAIDVVKEQPGSEPSKEEPEKKPDTAPPAQTKQAQTQQSNKKKNRRKR
ncbi:MYND finger family protein [Aphelenchoides avenae]|nr:MYND finger family protein [Aphelenchus avenae]